MSNEHILLVARNSKTAILFPVFSSEEAANGLPLVPYWQLYMGYYIAYHLLMISNHLPIFYQ